MRRVVVVIPTYNEAENLTLLVPEVLAQDERIEVLVVDDNSPDGTGKLADELSAQDPRVHVLHRSAKQGLGAAYRAGLARALELDADFVIQMDCDFSHPPDALPQMIALLDDCDVVLGSRYVNGITVVNWPIERILISYFGNWYARKVTGLPIRDTTGGFRAIRSRMLHVIPFERMLSYGYAFQIELNYRFVQRGARIKEVPFFFVDRQRGTSKLGLRIGLRGLVLTPQRPEQAGDQAKGQQSRRVLHLGLIPGSS